MGLFKKKKENEEISISRKEIKGLHIPEDISNDKFYKSSVLGSFILGLMEIGDYEDYKALSEISARTFFEKNKNIFKKLVLSSEDSLAEFVELLNRFLSLNNLGFVQAIINETESKVYIKHFNSPFALTLRSKEEGKVCHYLSEFYSKLFSLVLEQEINVKEVSCASKISEDYCLFEFTT